MLFQKENVLVRYVIEDDAPIISKWLSDPEVLQYYEGRDNPQSVEKYWIILYILQIVMKKVFNRIGYRSDWLHTNVPG